MVRSRDRARKPFYYPFAIVLPLLFAVGLSLILWSGELSAKEQLKPQPQLWQIDGIAAALSDARDDVKVKALEQLASYDPKALQAIVKPEIVREIGSLVKDKRQNSDVLRSAAEALGKFGDAAKDYVPNLLDLIKNNKEQSFGVRDSAVAALGEIGNVSKEQISVIADLLKNEEELSYFRIIAVKALRNLGYDSRECVLLLTQPFSAYSDDTRSKQIEELGNFGNTARDYIPAIGTILKNKDESKDIRSSAAISLSKFGDNARDYIPYVLDFIKDEKGESTIEAFVNFGDAAKKYVPQILKLIKEGNDKDFSFRLSTARTLGKLADISKDHAPIILDFIKDNSNLNFLDRAEALRNFGDVAAKAHTPEIAEILRDPNQDPTVRESAALVLIRLGNSTKVKENIPAILKLIKERKGLPKNRLDIVMALGSSGSLSKDYIPIVVDFILDKEKVLDEDIPMRAIEVLDRFGESAKKYMSSITDILKDEKQDLKRRIIAARALSQVEGKLSLERVIFLLNSTYDEMQSADELRFYAYFFSGGDQEVKRLLRWVAKPKPVTEKLERDEAAKTLEVFEKAWKASEKFTNLRKDLAENTAQLVNTASWQPQDVDLLKRQYNNLKAANMTQAAAVQAEITALEGWQWLFNTWQVILTHAAFWLALVFAYPKSTQIQAIFFWNPWVRKLVGVGYVGLLLTLVPFLRRKLFEPFQTDLHADAGLENFDGQTYFGDSDVKAKGWKTAKPIKEVIPALKGQIILQAESGLGKTTYLRHLMRQSKRLVVYLTAVECAQTKDKDVIQAIQTKLPVAAADADFLRSLIYSGAIDIYIDGLNEVNAETRAKIAAFVRSYSKGNIIVTTQPLPDWTPPSTAKTYILQSLRQDQIAQFLVSRPLPDDATVRDAAYANACHTYLEQALDDQQPPNDLEVARRVLSNPMDLDTVAGMLAKGEQPDLFHLQAQLYAVVANDYKERHLGYEFPLKQVSEAAYQMRLNDKLTLPKKEFDDAIVCMERKRMVVSKQSQDAEDKSVREWYFRHDKLWEFFIAQTFLGSKPEAEQRRKDRMGDPRFRGVYLLLGSAMELPDAIALMDEFVLYAANTNDHTVSDRLVQIVRSR